MGIIPEDADADTIVALMASSVVSHEANLSIDLTIEPLFSDSKFFVFSFKDEDKDSELFFTFFLAAC